MPRLLLLLLLAAPYGCAPRIRSGPGAEPALRVRLVDSVPWAHELGEGVLHRVEVRRAGRVDTVPDLLTAELPLRTGPATLLGFAYRADAITAAFEYDARGRRTRLRELPADFHAVFSAPAFAPDGRHLAYLVFPGDATAWAVARSWPEGRLVWRSERVEVPATDAPGGNRVRWLSPDTAEARVETGSSTGRSWYRVLGSIRRGAVISADSVPQRPG